MVETDLRLHEATFRAFGSGCRVVSDVESSVLAAVHRLEDLEARWSRFRDNSEVSRANGNAGGWSDVSEITQRLFARAVDASTLTGGVMNPMLLNELVGLGYDRSHEQLDPAADGSDPMHVPPSVGAFHTSADIDIEGGRVRLPPGAAFDPGGIGKGLAADIVMEDLLDAGATWALVSLGGDLRFGGATLAERGWRTQIEDPRNPGTVWDTVSMRSGALATSSTLSRRWEHHGTNHHHLLDPRTGKPCATSRVAATIHADEAWWADVVAKVAVIDDQIGRSQLEDWGVCGLIFTPDGALNVGLT